jgi:hypothetical protein
LDLPREPQLLLDTGDLDSVPDQGAFCKETDI